ncbi:MAG: isoleucine--tRNA ligase [Holosporales bacterium]|jgi:isoleucyl-tRNA synthetase|nr:isoleucine--tRNA ligase [Holosporales bacterium]
MTQAYKDSLCLPQTGFPLHGDAYEREKFWLDFWEKRDLYARLRTLSTGRPRFILHDGPPYANGTPHMGHALNRILKDAILRLYQMSGWDAPFVPGWDCHGLPIEWKVEENFRAEGREKDTISAQEFRTACHAFAHHWIGVQKDVFQQMGTCADWEHPYITTDPKVEAIIVGELGKFLLSGALYQGERPVLWSIVEQTALAEAEVEYRDKSSTSLYVAFPVVSSPLAVLKKAACAIWTTTPWTLPANRAIAYGENINYCVVRFSSYDLPLVVAEARLAELTQALNVAAPEILAHFPGKDLEGTICHHPWRGQGYDFSVPLLPGDHVDTSVGTGLVHTAPAHGLEDFALGCQFQLEVAKYVREDGIYTEATPLFAGQSITTVDAEVIAHLEKAHCLLAHTSLRHSFPHSWRSKAPLIFRTTPQWFISLEKTGLRQKALQAIEQVRWIPPQGRNRIQSFVENRGDWCISRQRIWGVPLAIFVEKSSGAPLRDPDVVERTVRLVEEKGAGAWFTEPPEAFLGPHYKAEDFTPIPDIVDVWFESGCTHAYVLETRPELHTPADLYLEGSDQHRGWFQSSLLASVGTRGVAPFHTVLTHGFLLDEEGYKMSKSSGNGIDPVTIMTQKGADVLRLWVLSSDFKEDVRVGTGILKQQEDLYKRLRNTVRYLLGNLHDFTTQDAVPYEKMPSLERWVLHRLTEIDQQVMRARETFALNTLLVELQTFCANDLSAFYFDVRKDRLYCEGQGAILRRSCQTVLEVVFETLVRWLAPFVPFLAEEAWQARLKRGEQSLFETLLTPPPSSWHDAALGTQWKKVRLLRRVLTGALEAARKQGLIHSGLEAALEVSDPEGQFPQDLLPELADLAIVSQAKVQHAPLSADFFTLPDVPNFGVRVRKAEGAKCARCWKILTDVTCDLCPRCQAVIST